MMMCLAVAGLRSIFSLPVSLKANWVLQVTQLSSPEHYIAATRRAMLVLATIPVWLTAGRSCALLSALAAGVGAPADLVRFVGSIMTDAALIGVSKIPFACSHSAGQSRMCNTDVFWAFAAGLTPLAMSFSRYEQRVLDDPALSYVALVAILVAAASRTVVLQPASGGNRLCSITRNWIRRRSRLWAFWNLASNWSGEVLAGQR